MHIQTKIITLLIAVWKYRRKGPTFEILEAQLCVIKKEKEQRTKERESNE